MPQQVMNGPMAGAAGGALAAAVAKGGGLPFIAAGHAASEETFAEEVQLFRTLTSGMNPTVSKVYPLISRFIKS